MNEFERRRRRHEKELEALQAPLKEAFDDFTAGQLIAEERLLGNDDGKSAERRRRVEEFTS